MAIAYDIRVSFDICRFYFFACCAGCSAHSSAGVGIARFFFVFDMEFCLFLVCKVARDVLRQMLESAPHAVLSALSSA